MHRVRRNNASSQRASAGRPGQPWAGACGVAEPGCDGAQACAPCAFGHGVVAARACKNSYQQACSAPRQVRCNLTILTQQHLQPAAGVRAPHKCAAAVDTTCLLTSIPHTRTGRCGLSRALRSPQAPV